MTGTKSRLFLLKFLNEGLYSEGGGAENIEEVEWSEVESGVALCMTLFRSLVRYLDASVFVAHGVCEIWFSLGLDEGKSVVHQLCKRRSMLMAFRSFLGNVLRCTTSVSRALHSDG